MKRLIQFASLILALAGCSSYIQHPPADIPDGKQTYKDEVLYYGRDYLISPGDEIEVVYHIDTVLKDKYILSIGDQIRVEFFSYPQLDRTLDIRPDGRITVPFKGDIMAFGLTPTELAASIDKAYADLLKQPKSTVTLIRYGQRIRDLKDAIKTAPRGQSRLVLVQPDGKINLPLIPSVMVAGKTIDHAQREINTAYDAVIPGMFTSASLLNVKGNQVYVFGAVAKPGFLELRGPTTAIQAVAIAGGFTNDAETSSVLLITRNEQSQAVGRLLDHKSLLSDGNIGRDILLRQADVIYVPKTRLSQTSLVFEFIRRIIPYSFVFSYGLTQDVLPPIEW